MRETIGAVVRKPVFRIKLIAISLLFVVSLIEQVSNNYIQSSGQQVGRMTVILLLMHTFSYFSFYLSVFFVGYILLIPDIVKDAFIERQTMMRCQSRMRAAKYAIGKIIIITSFPTQKEVQDFINKMEIHDLVILNMPDNDFTLNTKELIGAYLFLLNNDLIAKKVFFCSKFNTYCYSSYLMAITQYLE